MDKKLYKFGMDWLNGVLPVSDVWSVFEMLEKFSSKLRFDRWTLLNSGRYNYARRYALDGEMAIQLMYNPVSENYPFFACCGEDWDLTNIDIISYHNNPGIFFSISGDGIRKLHHMGGDVSALNKLLFYFYRNSFKASRFDTYCDILDDKNEIVPLIQEAFDYVGREQVGKPCISTRLRRCGSSLRTNFNRQIYTDDNGVDFTNCTLGHHGSTVGMFRCYNKYYEVRDGRLSHLNADGSKKDTRKDNYYSFDGSFADKLFKEYGVKDYWYRLEYEMHKENAAACFDALMSRAEEENSPLCFEDIFNSVFERVFRICSMPTANYRLVDSPTCDVWASFGAELQENCIHLVQFNSVPYIKCSLSRLGKNANRICGYYYAIGQYLHTLSPEERRQFLYLARDKFENQPKYNLLRDELEEFKLDSARRRSEVSDLSWTQSEFDWDVFNDVS